jgi:hypothetical protein
LFGYVVPDKENMYIKDFTLFRAYYCGLCMALAKTGAPHTRLCTNYDTTFLNVLVHSLNNVEITVKPARCVLSPFRKKPILVVDELTKRVADVSVLLVYYKTVDDIEDGKKFRRFAKLALSRRAKKAKRAEPEIDAVMENSFRKLREIERENCAEIDRACEPFADMLAKVTQILAPKIGEEEKRFAYNLGKLVYLFDALDDVEKDAKSQNYNPLAAAYGKCQTKAEFLQKNSQNLQFVLKVCYNQLVEDYNNIKVPVSEGVLSNIVYLGLKMQLEKLLKGEEACVKTRL